MYYDKDGLSHMYDGDNLMSTTNPNMVQTFRFDSFFMGGYKMVSNWELVFNDIFGRGIEEAANCVPSNSPELFGTSFFQVEWEDRTGDAASDHFSGTVKLRFIGEAIDPDNPMQWDAETLEWWKAIVNAAAISAGRAIYMISAAHWSQYEKGKTEGLKLGRLGA